jgi:hypothetical protein
MTTDVQNNKQSRKPLIITIISLSIIGAIIYGGFGEETKTLTACSSDNKSWVDARYCFVEVVTEQVECEALDNAVVESTVQCFEDIERETCHHLPASEVFQVITHNGIIKSDNSLVKPSLDHGVYEPETPPISIIHDGDGFDRYIPQKSSKTIARFSDGDFISINKTKYLDCLIDLDNPITVNTWFGISYGAW